ncbi:MAG: hypothetical protein KF852_08475 [Saprospiraceae bacterium]|nr:hypothetical protein [Saprospiraceae bacterium]
MYMMYADCMFMIPNEQFGIEGEGVYSQKNFFNDNGPFFGLKDIGLLTGVTEEKSITGFRIWGKKSPFSQHGFFLEQYATTAPTANFFDYIILHRKSEAATPYR